MQALLIQFGFLVGGWILHTLMKLYELDKATPGPVKISSVIWEDAEKWRTILLVMFMGVVSFGGMVDNMLSAVGISVEGVGGLSLLLISAGYNIDSISAKVFSLAKSKPEEGQ